MKLRTWLDQTNRTPTGFAAEIEVTPLTVFRYLSGERRPNRTMMARIRAKSGGEVTGADFDDVLEEDATEEAGPAAGETPSEDAAA